MIVTALSPRHPPHSIFATFSGFRDISHRYLACYKNTLIRKGAHSFFPCCTAAAVHLHVCPCHCRVTAAPSPEYFCNISRHLAHIPCMLQKYPQEKGHTGLFFASGNFGKTEPRSPHWPRSAPQCPAHRARTTCPAVSVNTRSTLRGKLRRRTGLRR
jgi:hypothetical protein